MRQGTTGASHFDAAFVVFVLLTLAWGTFAFGSVYPWAFTPLAIACAVVGLAGLLSGRRPFADSRWVLIGLSAVVLLGLFQLLPLSSSQLTTVSPGTYRFLTRYDLRYLASTVGMGSEEGLVASPRHGISLAPSATWLAVGLLLSFAVFLAGMLRLLSSVSVMRLAKGVVGLGALLALVGIAQYAVLGDHTFDGMKIYGLWTPQSRLTTPFGPFVNKNHFAGWILMVLPLALGLAMSEYEDRRDGSATNVRHWLIWLSGPGGGQAMLAVLAAFLMTLSLVMTRSRSGLGGLAIVAILTSVAAAKRVGSRRLGIWLAAGFTVAGGLMLLWAGRDSVFGRDAAQVSPVGMRLAIWQVALSIVRDFPMFGSGLDTFGTATILYQSQGAMHYAEAHNDYLQILTEGGVVLAGLAAFIIVALVRAVRRRFQQDRDLTDIYWVRVGASIGLAAIAMQSAVEFSLQMPGNAAVLTTLLAIALYSPQRRRTHTTATPR